MRPPSSLPYRSFAAVLLAGILLVATSARAQNEPSSAATARMPPEPPPRPDELRTLFPAGETPPSPILGAPPPPERPPELSMPPAAAREAPNESPAAQAAPLPPPRPDELRTLFPAGDAPPSPILDAPPPPERPSDLSANPAAPEGAPAERPPEAPSEPLPMQPAPLTAPLPPPRPDELRTQFPAGETPPSPILAAPPPPERPSDLTPLPAQEAPLPPGRPPELSGESALKLTIGAPEDEACLRRLGELGVTFTKQDPIVNGQCSVAHPLTVSVLGNGIVLRPGETMVCRVAEALAKWSSEAQRIAEAELGDSLKGVNSAGAYVCRGQNHNSEAPLSDHAFANAIDIAGFTFAKRAPITVGTLPEGTKEAAFLAAVRAKACGFFTTVLGPGTDEAHATHLHFDARERRSGYRLCQ